MKIIYLIFLIVGLISLSCKVLPPDPGVPQSEVFKSNLLTMVASPDYAVLDIPILISERCTPLYSGKGFIQLTVLGGGQTLIITSPINETLVSGNHYEVSLPCNFTANEEFIQSWNIILKTPPGDYTFEGFVRMDSLKINERLYSIESEESKNIAPVGHKFNYSITSGGAFALHHK